MQNPGAQVFTVLFMLSLTMSWHPSSARAEDFNSDITAAVAVIDGAAITTGTAVTVTVSGDYSSDIKAAIDAVNADSTNYDEDKKTVYKNALKEYGEKRAAVLNRLIDALKSNNGKLSDWNSARDEGAAAYDKMANLVPFDKVKLEDFGKREKSLWDLLKNSPLLTSNIEMASIMDQEIKGMTQLDDDWKKAVGDSDAYYDEIQRQLNGTTGDISDFMDALKAANKLGLLAGGWLKKGTDLMIKGAKAANTSYDTAKRQTAVWQSFLDERAAAKQLYDKVDYSHVDDVMKDATDAASALSALGSDDIKKFQDLAMQNLVEHQKGAKELWDKFNEAVKGKFVGSINQKWRDMLERPDFLDLKDKFDLQSKSLTDLLTAHEADVDDIEDADLKAQIKDWLNDMELNGKDWLDKWQQGYSAYRAVEDAMKNAS